MNSQPFLCNPVVVYPQQSSEQEPAACAQSGGLEASVSVVLSHVFMAPQRSIAAARYCCNVRACLLGFRGRHTLFKPPRASVCLQATQMQRGARFSLAAGLWGWPPAPGHAAPDQLAPDSWLLQFRDHHAVPDPAILSGVFTSCRAGRDWVLGGLAREVSLTLDTTNEHPSDAWVTRIGALRQALCARGVRPVRLTLLCSDAQHSSTASYAVAGLMQAGQSAAITELTLRDPTGADSCLYMQFAVVTHHLIPALIPHLTTLSLEPCPWALPLPHLLPQLRSLRATLLNSGAESRLDLILSSIAPLTTQLTTLTINERYPANFNHPTPWLALAPAVPSHTLTSFSTNGAATDALMSVLLDSFTALETLQIDTPAFDTDHSDGEWGVRQLTVGDGDMRDSWMLMLPRCREGGGR